FIDSSADFRNNAIDHLQDVAIVPERDVRFLQNAAALDIDHIFAVDKNVGNLGVAKERLQRSQTEHFIQKIGLDFLFLRAIQGQLALGDDALYQPGNRLLRFARLHRGQLLQIELGDQGSMNIGFKLLEI